jgi:hypothetical protein
MNKVQNFFFQLRNKYKKPISATHQFPNFKEAKKIGFLFINENRSMSTVINRFMKNLLEQKKVVDALTFMPVAHQENPYGFRYDICTARNISWLGEMQHERVKEFITTDYDYLFCVTLNINDFLSYVLQNSKAKCRVGIYQEGKENLFELMIHLQADQDLDVLIEQMQFYTHELVKEN